MKREGYIFERVCDLDNIRLAIQKASQGKRQKKYVRRILSDPERYARVVQRMLQSKSYVPSPYRIKTVLDGPARKERTIFKPRFYPDQVIHWALMLQLQTVIMRGMYGYTCGSVPGRGTGYGQKALRRWLDSDYRGTKYCLKLDISKFYPSVDIGLLKTMFRHRIKDVDCLWLIDAILDSVPAGLPIGNYTSQWFSNFFLQGLDHYIKEVLRVKYYVRYVDDLVLLGGNKKALHRARLAIDEYLRGLHLQMKPNWQVFLVNARAIDFLGFRFYRDHTTLRKRNALRIRRRLTKIQRKGKLSYTDACAVVSYWGWLKRSDSYRFYHAHVKPKVSLARARRRISEYGRAGV
ncbi:MAG TPA: RNA-directed DNA polymerase [Bellilinea sp.]|nr:RNA-directed DNA polymerase [Bellilinea sp.]